MKHRNTARLLWAVSFSLLPIRAVWGAADEVRGTWVTTTGYTSSTSTVYNAQSTDTNFAALRSIGLNSIYMDIWRNGNTYFQSPTNAAITGSLEDPALGTRDMLADTVLQAHRNQMSIFGWFQYGLMAQYGNPSSSTTTVSGYMASKGWLLQDAAGAYTDSSNGDSWMNPLIPQVQNYIKNMLLEAVNKYNLQGIQLDDHMGWPIQFGYDAYTKAQYLAETGNVVPTNYNDAAFTTWRSQKITSFMQSLVSALHADKPSLIISDSPPIYPFSYQNYCENWPQWQQMGLFNEYVPQVYTTTSSSFKTDWNGSGGVVSNMGGQPGTFAGGIAINISSGNGYNSYSTVVSPSLSTVRSTTGIKGEVLWYSDGVLQNQANLTSAYNVAGLGQANRPDVPASQLMAPLEGSSTGSNTWQFTVATGQYYDLIAANGYTWRTQQTAIYLTPGTYSFPVTSATQVELLENSTVALNSPLVSQWGVSAGGTWSTDTNWSGLIVPDGSGASANLQSTPTGLSAAGNIVLDSNRVLGHLLFDSANSYTISAGGGTLTIDNRGPLATLLPSITVNTGSHFIAVPITLAAGVTVTTASATNLSISGAINGSGGLIKSGTGNLTLSGINSYAGPTNVSGGSLTLNTAGALPAGTHLTIGAGASLVAGNFGTSTTLQLGSLNITGTLDLQNNDLDITGSTLAIVTSLVKIGFNNGSWNASSSAIVSSIAANSSSHLTALGVIANDNGLGKLLYGSGGTLAGIFDGTRPAYGDVLVKYTYYGDANLDGAVDGSDYSRIDAAFVTNQNSPNSVTGWYNGDFNYDGVIDGSDYTLIDNAFNSQTTVFSDALADPLVGVTARISDISAVPEPSGVALVSLLVVSAVGRRLRAKIKVIYR